MAGPRPLGAAALLLAAAAGAAGHATFLPVARAWAGRAAGAGRRLNQAPGVCRAVALRLMPSPAVKAYDACFHNKLMLNSSHDWSVPGAEVAAQVQCWCQHYLTETIQEYSCCDHSDIYPMCTIDCQADCSSQLARQCVQECPSMCFEAAEYIVDASLCSRCNWARCWPVVGCLTDHAEQRVDNGSLTRTCHENDFKHSQELANYQRCWTVTPKHTSHWNILSSLVHCICREGMDRKARETHCCDSVLWGGGVCQLECLSEQQCASQEAQTCVHGCQRKCPAYEVVPSADCLDSCLKETSPCRKYVSCRPPSATSHVCDDGRWPEASSGCCKDNNTQMVGCPSLCGTQRVWRLDRTRAVPWWARRHNGEGIVAQCTCMDCPESTSARYSKLRKTVSESIWDNGQVMLVEIARREGLRLGANRHMQELMLRRNSEIIQTIEQNGDSGQTDRRIALINDHYSVLISDAASLGEDPLYRGRGSIGLHGDSNQNVGIVTAIVVSCSAAVLTAVAIATWLVLRKRVRETPITSFNQTQQVVIGSPVPLSTDVTGATTGAPVTVAAPTKGGPRGKDDPAVDLS